MTCQNCNHVDHVGLCGQWLPSSTPCRCHVINVDNLTINTPNAPVQRARKACPHGNTGGCAMCTFSYNMFALAGGFGLLIVGWGVLMVIATLLD